MYLVITGRNDTLIIRELMKLHETCHKFFLLFRKVCLRWTVKDYIYHCREIYQNRGTK